MDYILRIVIAIPLLIFQKRCYLTAQLAYVAPNQAMQTPASHLTNQVHPPLITRPAAPLCARLRSPALIIFNDEREGKLQIEGYFNEDLGGFQRSTPFNGTFQLGRLGNPHTISMMTERKCEMRRRRDTKRRHDVHKHSQ